VSSGSGDRPKLPPRPGSPVRTEPPAVEAEAPKHPSTAPPPPSPVAAFDVGNVVAGKYMVERVIGEGGLGIVVAAKHLKLGQRVAIKYLLPATLKSPNIVERFLREARLAACIRSEHVARIYDVATLDNGVSYIVMEYLEGSDLRALLRDGPIPAPEAVDFLLQACEALAEAHTAGIVHRDLKPDNFFLAYGPGGTASVKLLDFGISKMTLEHTDSKNMAPLTTDTDKFGTPAYMSPEQLHAAASVDARADIWSLGVVLFESLTERLPFNGESFPQLCTSIVSSLPHALLDFSPDAPPELEPIILRCLEKDAGQRYQDVGELAEALAPFGVEASVRRVEHIQRVLTGALSLPPTRGRLLSLSATASGGYPRVYTPRSGRPSGVSSSGPVSAIARDTRTTTAPELVERKRTRVRSVAALGLTALVSLAVGVAFMTLRARPVVIDGASALHTEPTPHQAAVGAASPMPVDPPPAPASASASTRAPTTEPSTAVSSASPVPAVPSASAPTAALRQPHKPQASASAAPSAAKPPGSVDLGGVIDPFQ